MSDERLATTATAKRSMMPQLLGARPLVRDSCHDELHAMLRHELRSAMSCTAISALVPLMRR
jgi:hypothetical protein